MSNSVFSSLETLNFKSMTLETIVKRIIDWTFTGGIKLIIGTLAIVIGFKIINKLSKRFINLAEKRNVDMTLIKFIRACCHSSISRGCYRSCTSRKFIKLCGRIYNITS